jgi:hypothetical protein
MQATEEQKQTAAMPENTPQTDSKAIKRQHGGKRSRAGRKPNPTKLSERSFAGDACSGSRRN